jgi:hypothetical protein
MSSTPAPCSLYGSINDKPTEATLSTTSITDDTFDYMTDTSQLGGFDDARDDRATRNYDSGTIGEYPITRHLSVVGDTSSCIFLTPKLRAGATKVNPVLLVDCLSAL